MKRVMYFAAIMMTMACMLIGASAEEERRRYYILSTYEIDPGMIISLESIEYNILNLKTKEDVKGEFGDLFYEDKNDLLYVAYMEGLRTSIYFLFEDDILYGMALSPIPAEGGGTPENYIENGISMYNLYYDIFTNRLGEPNASNKIWYDETYKSIPEKYEYAFDHGHYIYESTMWQDERIAVAGSTLFPGILGEISFLVLPVPEGWAGE